MKSMIYDVAVIGGGPAGVTAAVTAARLGAVTLLVERLGELGGAGLQGFHPYICGLYRNAPDLPFDLLNRGLTEEVLWRLSRESGADGRQRVGRVEVHAMRTSIYRRVLKRLASEQRGLRVARMTAFTAIEMTGDRIESLRLAGADGGCVKATMVIDATGDGEVLRQCGAGCEPKAGERQLAGYCLRLINVNDSERMAPIRANYCVRRATQDGRLPAELRYTTFTLLRDGACGILKLSLCADTTVPRYDQRALSLGDNVLELLRRETAEFANASVVDRSPRVLQRSGTSLRGAYRLNQNDVLRGRHFEDGCIRAAWPIEFWDPVTGPTFKYLNPGAWYTIPAGCLRSACVTNLYAAGRCISATGRALASARVIGTCLALGEASAKIAVAAYRNMEKSNACTIS